MITKVTGKNQVTVPVALARELDIGPGTHLEWQRGKQADTVTIRVLPSTDALLHRVQEMGAPYRAKAKKMLADLQQMRDEDDLEYAVKKGVRR